MVVNPGRGTTRLPCIIVPTYHFDNNFTPIHPTAHVDCPRTRSLHCIDDRRRERQGSIPDHHHAPVEYGVDFWVGSATPPIAPERTASATQLLLDMDIISTRFQHRARAPNYLDREQNGALEDSGNDSESLNRRKFQRTAAARKDASDETFRKPTLPASATRTTTDQRPSLHHRRRSTLRDTPRVPSGPREFPSPGRRVASGSAALHTPSMSNATNSSRTFLPHESSSGKTTKPSTFSSGNTASRHDSSYLTSSGDSTTDTFDFIPSVSFDDLQNSIANYDGNGPLLSESSTVGSEPAASKSTARSMANGAGNLGGRPPVPRLEPRDEAGVNRSESLRRRLSAATVPKSVGSSKGKETIAASAANAQPGSLSVRTKRQSTAPMGPPPTVPAPPPLSTGARQPRKSVGPGGIANTTENRKSSQTVSDSGEESKKEGTARMNSIRSSRRTTMQPTSGAEPRASALTAMTQSRANKVKSFHAPPPEPATSPPQGRSASKSAQHRAPTPLSAGSKRQSTISGRASGLGARTISPTDARRLKRLSMMQAPPMPTSTYKEVPSMPQEDVPSLKLELPRFTQASPSLIPRKANSSTPNSARESPEGRSGPQGGGVSLSSKSSFQSLLLPLSASTSRLPTPKTRNLHSSSAQYGDEEEMVPPVPAIPKAYESPREIDAPHYFAGTLKTSRSSQNMKDSPSSEYDRDGPLSARTGNSFTHTRTKPSTDQTRAHQRMNTIENIEQSVNMTAPKPARPQNDANGRKNGNLQPLRLPPLNLMPIHASGSSGSNGGMSRPSQEVERPNISSEISTPEPKRVAKTPSTPMTASKAISYQRQDEAAAKTKAVRSASSHFALRDLMHLDESATRFFDDSDIDLANMGLTIPSSSNQQRNAITPFSSGSLPKASGEYIRSRVRASGDDDTYSVGRFDDGQSSSAKPLGPRASRSGTTASTKTGESRSSFDSPRSDAMQSETKKENSASSLRRKLSKSWRKGSSKSNNLPDAATKEAHDAMPTEKSSEMQFPKRLGEMPPPKLPASATWTGDLSAIPTATSARPSMDSLRGKAPTNAVKNNANGFGGMDKPSASPAPKTKSVHGEQPQPVQMGNRASSWGNFGARNGNYKAPPSRQVSTSSTFSAQNKDKDDLSADDEMRRLSQKRRDVDTAAKQSEELKRRAVARSPMSPDRVLHDRNCTLNIFERGEIVDYAKEGVFFTGTKSARKIIGSLTPSPTSGGDKEKAGNYGYDDERGDYNIVMGDHLAYRYEVVDLLGKGSFGQVVRCVDHKDGGIVAIKIIRNKKRFHQQALVEVGILSRLREWDPDGANATLSITSSFYFRSHLCIVTPCLSINLYELIRAHNFGGFSLPLIRRFSRQLLSCLVLLQNKRIIHCDLKPENILLCEARKADVRVIDFGSSCKEEEKVYTYIQSRFYRSPEVILGSSYGLGIDMWSLGCILAELWTGYPLFPGENEQEQLACIMEIFGPPDRHLVERSTRKKLFFDSVGKPRVTVSSKGRRRRPSSKTLSQAMKTDDEAFLDFVSRCLRWDPERRMKPHEAIHHPFITNLPFHQRPGIPEEARRAARTRLTTAAPAVNGNNPSPVKRSHATTGSVSGTGIAYSQQQQTPLKDRARPLPETPQTALRNGVSANARQGSPSKFTAANRRQSSVQVNGAAAAGGVKRTSNGLTIGNAATTAAPSGQRLASGQSNGANLAQMAAKEANTARWRG
ncbi:hypothetical protein TI39_contig562g00016 [Zymoseptoria brevis]|uniref:Protein kinase domain-containing protein n=1 Tax=Zymoseptoria brevis TaxID=1047168 RepID=A0A0F4GLL2_9PEZI|nr:hypothetical protein TI39_contig562g00016 [Zymoseptoria brevis]